MVCAPTTIYTLSLHDALPISRLVELGSFRQDLFYRINVIELRVPPLRERREDIPKLAARVLERLGQHNRSEEHTSELQSPVHLVCRLLLEKKNKSMNRLPSRG